MDSSEIPTGSESVFPTTGEFEVLKPDATISQLELKLNQSADVKILHAKTFLNERIDVAVPIDQDPLPYVQSALAKVEAGSQGGVIDLSSKEN